MTDQTSAVSPYDECPATGSRVAAMPPLMRLVWLAVFFGFIAVLTVLSRPGGHALTGPVIRVVDGDTIHVQLRERTEPVRYIGIETPHPARSTTGEPPDGREPAETHRRLVEGRTVRLELDVQERDEAGRLLAYVYVDDLMVNAELIGLGHAQVTAAPPNVRHQDLFVKLEQEAREQKRGLWAAPSRGED